jgi:hypothetical protein
MLPLGSPSILVCAPRWQVPPVAGVEAERDWWACDGLKKVNDNLSICERGLRDQSLRKQHHLLERLVLPLVDRSDAALLRARRTDATRGNRRAWIA